MAEIGSEEIKSKPQETAIEKKKSLSLEKKIINSDPRDYLMISTFQKHARKIDPDLNHPWEVEPNLVAWSNDPKCELVVETVFNKKDEQKGLLLAMKVSEKEITTTYLTDLDPSVRDFAFMTLELAAKSLPMELKTVFVQNFVKESSELAKMSPDKAVFKIASQFINVLPSYPGAVPLDEEIKLPKVDSGGLEISTEQRADLQNFFSALNTKMPATAFQENLDKFINEAPFIDNLYGKNFKYIFSDSLRWLSKNRPEMENYYLVSPKTHKETLFPVKDLVRRKISSSDELRMILSEMPVKPLPDFRYFKKGETIVEFVNPEKIVGGVGITDWSIVSTSSGRGFETIKKFTEGFTNGTIDVSGSDEPIYLEEINGDYFIERDGRHRIAALKALDIPFIPVMVTHINNDE